MTTLECNGLDIVEMDEEIAECLTDISLEHSKGYITSLSTGVDMDGSIKVTLEMVFYK